MKRKILLPVVILMVVGMTAAGCAGMQLPWSTGSTQGEQSTTDLANQPVENKLAIGTLLLEDTDNAVTAEQAKKLLPLWKAVRGLSNDIKTTTAEMTGLYKQIMAAMTPEQVKAIQDMTLEPGSMQQILQRYGMNMPRGGAPGQGSAARTPSASGGGAGQGGPTGGGPMGGGPMGGGPGGAQGGSRQNSGAQTTPQAGAARSGLRGELNAMLAEPLIRILEQRAGS